MHIELVVDITGWIGAAFLLAAYGLVSSGRLQGRSWSFQALNITGAVLLSINSGFYGAFPSVGLNAVWIGVGLYTLWMLYRDARSRPS